MTTLNQMIERRERDASDIIEFIDVIVCITETPDPKEARRLIKEHIVQHLTEAYSLGKKEGVEMAMNEVNETFCTYMHVIRGESGKNQLKKIAEIMHAFRRALNVSEVSLLKDDLRDQTEETKAFIAKLLK